MYFFPGYKSELCSYEKIILFTSNMKQHRKFMSIVYTVKSIVSNLI